MTLTVQPNSVLPISATARIASASLALAAVLLATPAAAQVPSGCERFPALLQERQNVVKQVQGWQKKKVDPTAACTTLTRLHTNGTTLMKFVEENGSWCQIPETFSEGIKTDHGRVGEIRGQACAAAAKQKQLRAQAERAQRQGGGPGGPAPLTDVTGGPMRVPSGAL